jgi:ribosome-binding protein aMBF1 (putative translation factor)
MGLVEQIRTAQRERSWSTQQLLNESGLDLDRSTLHRKLAGEVPCTDAECEALARALSITLVWPKAPDAGAAA